MSTLNLRNGGGGGGGAASTGGGNSLSMSMNYGSGAGTTSGSGVGATPTGSILKPSTSGTATSPGGASTILNPPRTRPSNAALEAELQRTQHHLSELIDEVVHSEKVAEAAEREVEARKRYTAVLEESLTNLLVYVSNVERKILLPAVGDLDLYLASSKFLSDPKMHRTVALAKASEGLALVPEARRQKLLDLLTKPLSETSHADISVARETALSGDGGHGSLPLEEAVVLIGQLVKSQEELQLLMTDTRQRYRQFNRETNTPGASTLTASGLSNDSGSASTAELAELRTTLDTLKRERELLLRKANETVTYEELQRTYHAEREQLQKRIAALETRLKQDDGSRVEVANRFETLQRALDQSYQEKLLLQQEVEKLRLQVARQSPSQVSLSNDKEMHSMRMEMDRIVRLHSANVTELESTIASLRIDLANAQATASIQTRQQLQHLHDENEKLRKSLTELQMRTASSPSAHGRNGGLGIGESSLDGKIKAFEITINGLNSELSAMEKKIVSSEARFLEERGRVEMMHERERQQYQDEREECDQLVLKMTNELESLVRENTALKMKLRSSGIY